MPWLLLGILTLSHGLVGAKDNCERRSVELDLSPSSIRCAANAHLSDDLQLGYWTEKVGRISNFLVWSATAIENGAVSSLVESATVRFSLPLRQGEAVRIVSLHRPPRGSRGSNFIRTVTGESREAIIPAGRFIALLVDAKARVIAVSRPFSVRPGEIRNLPQFAGDSASSTILRLAVPDHVDVTAETVKSALVVGSQRIAPDVYFVFPRELWAVWYAVEAAEAVATVQAEHLWMSPLEVTISRTGVTTADARLRLRPNLTVSVNVSAENVGETPRMLLKIQAVDAETPFIERVPISLATPLLLQSLPPSIVDVSLQIGDTLVVQRKDLTQDQNDHLIFDLPRIEVAGTVSRDGAGIPASLSFLQAGDPIRVKTDEHGRYALTLWRRGRFIVNITSDLTPNALVELITLNESRTLDFVVPSNRITVGVRDATDHAPIRDAGVGVRSTFLDAKTGANSNQVMTLKTDERGLVILPPLRPGTAEIRTTASGYVDALPVKLKVEDHTVRHLDIELGRPDANSVEIPVRLADGSIAAGAEAIVVDSSLSNVIWQGVLSPGEKGLTVPRRVLPARMIFRHRGGASVVRQIQADSEVTLPPPTPPLVIRVADRDGNPNSAALVLRWSDYLIAGKILSFFAWSSEISGGDGVWIGRNLPPFGVEVVATRAPSSTFGNGSQSVRVPFPWPTDVRVQLPDF